MTVKLFDQLVLVPPEVFVSCKSQAQNYHVFRLSNLTKLSSKPFKERVVKELVLDLHLLALKEH